MFDRDSDGSHDDMGRIETSLRQLLEAKSTDEFPVFEHRKASKKAPKRAGSLLVRSATVYREPTFLDYINGGWELNMVVGVDFTASNGRPSDPRSLHYRAPDGSSFNQYELSVLALADVITAYDQDQRYPLFGFGGRQLPRGVSHCFPLNGNDADPSVSGVDGILRAYADALTQWGLSGPTNFAPLIRAAAGQCRAAAGRGDAAYSVLLILTDGRITDVEATKAEIVEASALPLSVIIVGVGDADFSTMGVLDGDDDRLTDQQGRRAVRDIVQFVRFSDFAGQGDGARLAKETLAELPGQMLAYFEANRIQPAGGGGGGGRKTELGAAGRSLLKTCVSGGE